MSSLTQSEIVEQVFITVTFMCVCAVNINYMGVRFRNNFRCYNYIIMVDVVTQDF